MAGQRNGNNGQTGQGRDRYSGLSGSAARREQKKSALPVAVISVIFLLFVGGGLFFGCLAITVVRSLMTGEPAAAPSVPVAIPSITIPFVAPETPQPTPTTGPTVAQEEQPQWTGSDRINILLMGIDQRKDQRGEPTRTDTMIVLTIDPNTKTAGMLSIPRDLWVAIPNHGENKINTAHFFGEIDKKGGGPDLACRTIELNFGIKIHHYARVDFTGFETLIDTLGGITVDVPRPLKDDEYPTEDYGITRVYIPAGLQRMDGTTALQYARSRHSDSDFGRTHRQQQVLVAARQEALRLNMLPKLPTMIGTLTDSITTDFPVQDLPAFAMLIKDVDAGSISSTTIEGDMVVDVYGDGTMFLPKREEIKKAIDGMFSRTAPTPTAETLGPATISIHNGTERAGLASTMADALREKGYKIADVGNDARSDHEETLIISYRSKNDPVAQELAELLSVSKENVRTSASGGDGADILIILGADAKVPTDTEQQ